MKTPTATPEEPRPGDGSNSQQTISPAPLALVPPRQRDHSGRVIGHSNLERIWPGISIGDARHHLHVLGPTGTGKTTLLLRLILQDAVAGRGVAVLDPKGDLIRDLLDRLPASCADRLVLIDPDEHNAAPPALNLLDPATAEGSPHRAAEQVTSVMAKVWARWWGHRTADIAHHALLTLAHTPGATLTDLPRLLAQPTWRSGVVRRVRTRLGVWGEGTLGQFWDAYEQLTPSDRAAVTGPLLAKLRLVLAHPLAEDLFGVPATTFTLADVLDGGILLCRLPKHSLGEDGCRLIGSLILAGLWRATVARARLREDQRLDAAVYVDEAHNFLHLPIGLDDALAEARGLRTSFVLSHQYLGQLTDEMAEAIDANARNKIYFALSPRDARACAKHLHPYLEEGDLIRLNGYEAVLRPIAAGRPVPPCTVDTLPAPPARGGRAVALREAARTNTGLSQPARRNLRTQRHLTRSAATEPAGRGEPGSTCSEGVSVSLGPSLVSSLDSSPVHEETSETDTGGGVNPQVTGETEEP